MTFSIHSADLAPDTADENASDTTLAFSPSAAVPVGKHAVLLVVWDNVNGTNADDTSILSVADTQSNTWARGAECQFSAGAALDGVLVGCYYSGANGIATEIGTGDTITITSTANGTAKGVAMAAFNRDTAKTIAVAGKSYERVAAATAYSVTVASLTNEEHLWIGENGMESTASNVNDRDSTYTAIFQGGTGSWGAGTGAAGVGARGGYKISTSTSETYDRTSLVSADRATLLVAFREVTSVAVVTRRTLTWVGA